MPPEPGELRLDHIEQAPGLGRVFSQHVDDVGKPPIGLIGPRFCHRLEGTDPVGQRPRCAAGRRIGWVAGLCLYALGYYWFGWRGLLLAVLSSMARGLRGYCEARELIWRERDRILPPPGQPRPADPGDA